MSLATFFFEKCANAIQENVSLVLQKLSDPSSFINSNIVDSLTAAAKDGSGGIADISSAAAAYAEKNAQSLVVSTVGATAEAAGIRDAFNLATNYLAAGFMALNDLPLFFIKQVARKCVEELDTRAELIDRIEKNLVNLVNILGSIKEGPDVYGDILDSLREAILEMQKAETNLQLVGNTLASTSRLFLSVRFEQAIEQIRNARELVGPAAKAPVFEAEATQLLGDFGIPSTNEQIMNLLSVPAITKSLIEDLGKYLTSTLKINGYLKAIVGGLDLLLGGIPDYIVSYVLRLIDGAEGRARQIKEEMASVVNGSPSAITRPVSGYTPRPITVTTNSFKWILDFELLISSLTTMDVSTLKALTVTDEGAQALQRAADRLAALDDVVTPQATLFATDAIEEVGNFETQATSFMLSANGAALTSSVSDSLLALGRSLIARNNIARSRNSDIRGIVQAFVNTPLPLEEQLEELGGGMLNTLRGLGLDRAADALESGDFASFFEMNATTASYVGAGLAAIALLKDCFDNVEETDRLTDIQRELERDSDLQSFTFTLDFDLAILNNLDECLRLESLGNLFNLKEIICGLAEDSGIGSSFQALNDLVSF